VKTAEIIKNDLNNNLFKNVKNTDKSSVIWKQLCTICTQIDQKVIYAELCSLFFHLSMIKVQDHEKSINMWFAKINNLMKKIKTAVFIKQNV